MRQQFHHLIWASAWVVMSCVAAQEPPRIEFNLPSQSLGDALRAVGSEHDINVLFDPRGIEDQSAPAVKTIGTVDDALTLLLRDSGFIHRHLNDNTVVLVSVASTPAPRTTSQVDVPPISWLRVIEVERRDRARQVASALELEPAALTENDHISGPR